MPAETKNDHLGFCIYYQYGGYGLWLFAVSFDAGDIEDKIAQALQESTDRIRLDARRGA